MFCFHDRAKEFKFADGSTIKMCPDCTNFDNKRKAVVHASSVLQLATGSPVKHEPLPTTPIKTVVDSIYDHDWATRQRKIRHTRKLHRRFENFCNDCIEVILDAGYRVVRITRGVYLSTEHECNSVRIYDVHGNLLEVKSL